MKLKFISPVIGSIKATIQLNGRLGFSQMAAEALALSSGKSIKIAINEAEGADENLYLVILDSIEEDAFKVLKAGVYFYLNTKNLFNELGVDFEKNSVIYDIGKFDLIEGQQVWKLNPRVKPREPRKDEDDAESGGVEDNLS